MSTYTSPARVCSRSSERSVRTLPSSCAPSAVVSFTFWPTLDLAHARFGNLCAPFDATLAQQAQHLAADLRNLADVDVARGDDAVIGRGDARVAQAQLGSLQIGLAHFDACACGELFAAQLVEIRLRQSARAGQRLRASIRRRGILQRRLRLLDDWRASTRLPRRAGRRRGARAPDPCARGRRRRRSRPRRDSRRPRGRR